VLPTELVGRIVILVVAWLGQCGKRRYPRFSRRVDPGRPVVIGVDDTLPVGTERNGVDLVGLAFEYGVLLRRTLAIDCRIPKDAAGAVIEGVGEALTVWTQSHVREREPGHCGPFAKLAPGARVPAVDDAVDPGGIVVDPHDEGMAGQGDGVGYVGGQLTGRRSQ
jgi:hypothetical protein